MLFKQGRPLTAKEKITFKPYFVHDVLEKARIIDGDVPFWLRKKMVAVVVKHCIYFRPGAYQPGTKAGIALLGHELMHVSQFLHGMNWLKYLWSCRYGYRQSPYEIVAYATAGIISIDFQQQS